MKILITGGAGFIGSHLAEMLMPAHDVTVLDALTYAGRRSNLPKEGFSFVHGDIRNWKKVRSLISGMECIFHLACETHVDRSIRASRVFFTTNVMGTHNILEACRLAEPEKIIIVSTSEVYGTALTDYITERHPLNPQSPYAAAKCAEDRMAWAYYKTYGMPITIVRPFNTYGPKQHIEKLIPKAITLAIQRKPIPIYGDGYYYRDWIHVRDCCEGLMATLATDVAGEIINLCSGVSYSNVEVIENILNLTRRPRSLINYVADRPGHVKRLTGANKVARELLDWKPRIPFKTGLENTVKWYIKNKSWWKSRRFENA